MKSAILFVIAALLGLSAGKITVVSAQSTCPAITAGACQVTCSSFSDCSCDNHGCPGGVPGPPFIICQVQRCSKVTGSCPLYDPEAINTLGCISFTYACNFDNCPCTSGSCSF